MKKIQTIAKQGSYHLSSCMQPVIPLIIAGSLVKLLYILLDMCGAVSGSTANLLEIIGDVPFYFLPVLVAVSAADHFKTDTFYSLGGACVLLAPDFVILMTGNESVKFFSLPVLKNTYSYNILPVILMVWVLSKFIPWIEKKIPEMLHGAILPFVIFFVIVLLEIVVIAPLGSIIGQGLSALLSALSEHAGFVTWAIFAGLLPLLIPAGMHWIFVTTAITRISEVGNEVGTMASFLILSLALAGIDFAFFVKSKDKKNKATYMGLTLGVMLAGVSEPSLFSICWKNGNAMKSLVITNVICGIYQGLVQIKCFIYSFPAVPSVLIFHDQTNIWNVIHAIILMAMAFVISFILAMILCRNDNVDAIV